MQEKSYTEICVSSYLFLKFIKSFQYLGTFLPFEYFFKVFYFTKYTYIYKNDVWCSGDGTECLITEVKQHVWLVHEWEIHILLKSEKSY